MLPIPNWHKPYAELLLETDVVKLPARISTSEQEIMNRYRDRAILPITPEERLDLENAAHQLRLKKSEAATLTKQNLVASEPHDSGAEM